MSNIPTEPPPPNVIDLGNGEMWCIGTAEEMRAAAAWLRRNYPDGARNKRKRHGPWQGRMFNSNYGALELLAILGDLRKKVLSPSEADLRLAITLETFPADADGWRWVGGQLLAELAGLSYATSRRSRDRLIAAGLIEYRRGKGRGQRSSYRFAASLKVLSQGEQFYPVSTRAKGAQQGGEKVLTWPEKGAQQNLVTSENATHALEAFALGTSALEASEVSANPEPRRARNEAPAALDDLLDRFRNKHRSKLTADPW